MLSITTSRALVNVKVYNTALIIYDSIDLEAKYFKTEEHKIINWNIYCYRITQCQMWQWLPHAFKIRSASTIMHSFCKLQRLRNLFKSAIIVFFAPSVWAREREDWSGKTFRDNLVLTSQRRTCKGRVCSTFGGLRDPYWTATNT